MLDTILTYDATGGGVQAVVPPTSLTIKGGANQQAYLVGHFLDGISVNECTLTCATNPDWEAAGFSLKPTTQGIATSGGPPADFWRHKVPVRGGDVMVLTSTSGANPTHAGLYVDYPWMQGPKYQARHTAESDGHYVLKTTAAGGTNCAAGTLVRGATNLTGWMQGRQYYLESATISAAFTTTAFLGLRKLGSNNLFIWPCPLTDVAQAFQPMSIPKGALDTVQQGDQVEVYWSSVTAEQPTANTNWVY